jgi:hypothetical protein
LQRRRVGQPLSSVSGARACAVAHVARHAAVQTSVSLALISGLSVAFTDFDASGASMLQRLFLPPGGAATWSQGVIPFSEYQVCSCSACSCHC